MKQNVLEDREQILMHLNKLKGKIDTLKFVYNHLQNIEVKLEITFKEGDKILLDQLLIPFSLEMEIKNLIGDSIDEYQRQVISLKSLL